jgi:hypothetical protein
MAGIIIGATEVHIGSSCCAHAAYLPLVTLAKIVKGATGYPVVPNPTGRIIQQSLF